MVGQQIYIWACFTQTWTGRLFWNRAECLAGFPAKEWKSSFPMTTSNPVEATWVSGALSSKLFNISIPNLCLGLRRTISLVWLGAPVAGPAGREPTSALGTPPWPTGSFCQSRIHFLLGSLRTHHESRLSWASIHIDWDCQVTHPYPELVYPARYEGKLSPEESTGLFPHHAYRQKRLKMPLWGAAGKATAH